MPTFFEGIKRDFKDVTITPENKIDTSEFLEAAESLVTLFDLFGSAAFSVVQNDMTGNIKKIRDAQLKNPIASESVQDIVLSEKGQKKRDATQGLLWLTRGLEFTSLAMKKSIDNPTEELSVSFTNAYGESLTKYHNMMIRPVFKLAMKACPYRKDFYEKLAGGSASDVVLAQLKTWLDALLKIVAIIKQFFESGNYGKGL